MSDDAAGDAERWTVPSPDDGRRDDGRRAVGTVSDASGDESPVVGRLGADDAEASDAGPSDAHAIRAFEAAVTDLEDRFAAMRDRLDEAERVLDAVVEEGGRRQ